MGRPGGRFSPPRPSKAKSPTSPRPALEIVLPDAESVSPATGRSRAPRPALDRALADRDVDVVLTLGILTSQQAARRKSLPKPVIAPLVIDPVLQGYPLIEGRSGRHNFTYVADFQSVANEVRAFHEIVGFKYMVALVDDSLLAALPALSAKATELAAALNVRIGIVRVGDDVNAVLASIPAGSRRGVRDAAAVQRSPGARARAGPAARASYPRSRWSGAARSKPGLLMTTGGAERDTERLARRVAIMIQRIAQGEDPAHVRRGFPTSQRLLINMQVARAIGFSPRWQFLADAEQLHADAGDAQPLTLLGRHARGARCEPGAGREPRAPGQRARRRAHRAQRTAAVAVGVRRAHAHRRGSRQSADAGRRHDQRGRCHSARSIYSERAWAGYSIAKSLGAAQEQSQRADMLNTLTDAAVGLPERVARQVGRGSPPAQRREHAQESRDLARARGGGARRALRLPALGVAARARQADAAGGGSEPPAGGNRDAAHPASSGEPAFQHGGSRASTIR